MSAVTKFGRLRHATTMFVVAAASLLLLIYIGHGEAQRNYLKFVLDSVTAQGRIVQTSMEGYLRAGLPLRQYVGFATLASAISDSDDAISRMFVVDLDQRAVFESRGPSNASRVSNSSASASATRHDGAEVRRNNGIYQVVLPLRSKFETVGSLVIEVPRDYVSTRVQKRFHRLGLVAVALSLLFSFAVSFKRAARRLKRPWLAISYGSTFIAMSGFVVATLIALYSEGVQTKTKALAHSLAQRLSDIVAFNLKTDALEGLDHVFLEYKRLNPDISAAALTVNGVIQIHTNSGLAGRARARGGATYEYIVDLSRPQISANKVEVVVAVPSAVVYDQVLRTIKNFAVLFVASAVLAWLIMQLAGTLRFIQNEPSTALAPGAERHDSSLELVKPIFFIAVFLEHLAYPFLPQFVLETLRASETPASFVSAPFMAYYLCFALVLIPAGRYSERFGPRRLMIGGLLLAAIGLLGLGTAGDIGALIFVRGLAGIGQGMLFIGVQSYILETAPQGHTTRGAAIIVVGFQGGMISGTAIGSLLVGYIGGQGVFALAGCLAIAVTIYAICLLPIRPPQRKSACEAGAWRTLARDLARLLPNSGFLRSMLLIGVPAKAVMTGFVTFALPLILSRMKYAPEDIGQVIMLYAIGVLLASAYSARLVDRIGRSETALFWGAAFSGVSLLMVGLIDWQPTSGRSDLATVLLLAGTLFLGTAHGFILAPVVTRISECQVGDTASVHSAVITYRFVERVGHVLGPIIVGQLLILTDHSAIVATILGAGVLSLALAYSMGSQTPVIGSSQGKAR